MQQSREKFLIVENIKKFIIDLEKIIITFPKKDFVSRTLLYEDALKILELVYEANYDSRSEKKKSFQIEAMAKINKIDFYLERAYKLKYISEAQCIKFSKRLDYINRMLYSWCNHGNNI